MENVGNCQAVNTGSRTGSIATAILAPPIALGAE
jgi:hypothetical protein